jgi:ATP-binding cassette subfamily F protein uup
MMQSFIMLNLFLVGSTAFHLQKPSFKHSTSKLMMSDTTKEAPVQVASTGATVLRCEGLTKSFTGFPQFEGIKLLLGKGQRVGLIGVNGAGKSTLLKCLGKIDNADSGTVETASGANVIYVDQEPDWGEVKVYEALFSGTSDQAKATRMYMKALDPSIEMDGDAFSAATDAIEGANAWDYQERGLSIADNLNIKDDKMYRSVNTLSGGKNLPIIIQF